MGKYNVFKNGSVDIHIPTDYQDNGWSIENGNAIHNNVNSGFLANTVFMSESNILYSVNFNLQNISSGVLRVYLGNLMVYETGEVGPKSILVEAGIPGKLRFWSDANLSFTDLSIKKGDIEFNTILFDDDNNMFTGYASYTSDIMTKFLDDMYSFKEGQLWRHNVNEVRNSFYGVTYPSKITFYVNPVPTMDKDFYSMFLNASDPWYVEDIQILPREGKSRGQRSRIKQGNFKLYKGRYAADFLRDMNDPRFTTELEALMKGGTLQGMIMKVTISNTSVSETRLTSIETEYSVK